MKNNDAAALARIKKHIANLGSPDEKTAQRAEAALIRYYGSRAWEPLVEACADANPQVRWRAAYALGYTHDPRAYETILRLTADPDGFVRYDAAFALGILGDARAVAPLIALMQQRDEEHSAESAAAMGLVKLGQPAVPALLDALKEGTKEARCLAADVLEGIGDPRAAAPLAALLSGPDKDIRIAAIESLAQIGGSECLGLIQPCLQDSVPAVRKNAANWVKALRKSQKRKRV